MAFSFSPSLNAPPPASPVERRQKPVVRWFDSAVTIDSWLVEVYVYRPDDTIGSSKIASFYVIPKQSANNVAQIDISKYIEQPSFVHETPYLLYDTEARPLPSVKVVYPPFEMCDGYQFQVYSVTNGVKSALAKALLTTSQ